MKRWFGNVLALSGSALLMAGFVELSCRTVLDTGMQYHLEMWKYAVHLKRISSNPEIGHEHTPGSHAKLMGADVTINKLGLRNDEIAAEKPEGSTRILMLGDSITFGWGVAQDETMSVHLAKALNAVADSERPNTVEVINSGVGNYNTAMEVAYFMERGAALKPDTVVLNYFINDAEPTPVYRDVPWLARHSYAYAVLGGAWDGFKRRLAGEQDWRAYYAGLYADGAPGWKQAQDKIAALADYCRQNGIRLVMINIPELRELEPYAFPEIEAKIQTVAEANGIEYLDLLSSVQGEEPSALWVTAPDPHPNARAQRLMAGRLAGYLVEHTPANATDGQPK